jgi:quinol monooxygenase YgiN
MNTLPIVVKSKAKPDQIEFFKAQLIGLLEKTRAEEGCIQYDLHQDIDDPSIFVFYEIWETTDLWKKHDQAQHVVDFKIATKDCVESVQFNKLTLI